MAQQIITQLLDDLDDTVSADSTVEFSLDGVAYEIDLSDRHADELRRDLAAFIAAARRTGGRVRRGRGVPKAIPPSRPALSVVPEPAPKPPASDREQTRAVREWARANGYDVGDRGRIPAGITALFEQAHQPQSRRVADGRPMFTG